MGQLTARHIQKRIGEVIIGKENELYMYQHLFTSNFQYAFGLSDTTPPPLPPHGINVDYRPPVPPHRNIGVTANINNSGSQGRVSIKQFSK